MARVGFQYQGNSDGWTSAVRRLPKGCPVKFIDGVQRAREAKGVNAEVYTAIRHHVGEQNPQVRGITVIQNDKFMPGNESVFGPVEQQEKRWYTARTENFFRDIHKHSGLLGAVGAEADYHGHARDFFASFVDESFRREAPFIDAVHEYNEYFSNSQSPEEKARWIAWGRACVDVWRDDYRTQSDYSHIDLILAETAVGNDIPHEYAALSHKYSWVHLGYHPYVPVWMGTIRPDAWRWYSGRWNYMDTEYRTLGYTNVTWFFGEFGAVGHTAPDWPNSLAPLDGWRHSNVFNGNTNAYIDMIGDWMRRTGETRPWKEERVIGATIFTSGGGQLWRHFEVRQPEMSDIAIYTAVNQPPIAPPPPPPPPPPPECRGQPRAQYHRTAWVLPDISMDRYLKICEQAYEDRRSVMFSYDDGGIGDLDEKTVVLFGITDPDKPTYNSWYARHYPGTEVLFADLLEITLNVPLDKWIVTQRFGDNYDTYMGKWGLPGHNGIDFGVEEGTPVHAARGGTLKLVGNNPDGYGKHVRIMHEEGTETIYAHLSDIASLGTTIEEGEIIGWTGNTGWSTGPHLHFGVKVNGENVNPEDFTGPVAVVATGAA